MGWLFSTRWKSSHDVLDHYKTMLESNGYTVQREGHWFLAEGRGEIDLIHIRTMAGNQDEGWGYKDESIIVGPLVYNVPLWMVKRVHAEFKDHEYYQVWLNRYPKRNAVLKWFAMQQTEKKPEV